MQTAEAILERVTVAHPELSKEQFYEGLESLGIMPGETLKQAVAVTELMQAGFERKVNGAQVYSQHTLPVAFHVAYWAVKLAKDDPPLFGAQLNSYSIEEAIMAALGHDLVEDGYLTENSFIRVFGETVHGLVVPLTKVQLPRVRYDTELSYSIRREAENTGRLMRGPKLSIVIKGADRYNNAMCLPVPADHSMDESLVERTLAHTLRLLSIATQYFTELVSNSLVELGVKDSDVYAAANGIGEGTGAARVVFRHGGA